MVLGLVTMVLEQAARPVVHRQASGDGGMLGEDCGRITIKLKTDAFVLGLTATKA